VGEAAACRQHVQCNFGSSPIDAAGHKSIGVHACGVSVSVCMCINSVSMLLQNKHYNSQDDSQTVSTVAHNSPPWLAKTTQLHCSEP
jgi:hypothetical protein